MKVLFISHEASRTGAPLLLLHFLKWLKKNSSVEFRVLLKSAGELEPDFKRVGRTDVWRPRFFPDSRNPFIRLLRKFFLNPVLAPLHRLRLKFLLKKERFDVVYSNTTTNGGILKRLRRLNAPVITHIHELPYVIGHFGRENIAEVVKYSRCYIASTEAVRRGFIAGQNVPPEIVHRVNYYLVQNPVSPSGSAGKRLRAELNIPERSLIVGSAGTVEWRKGSDLMIHLARKMTKDHPDLPLYFLWIGKFRDEAERRRLDYDVKRAGLENRVVFAGDKENPADYYELFDVFVLLSREEPFGIVGVECAILEKPILCFSEAGGMPEFVENDAGFILPYLDLDAVAEKTALLLSDRETAARLGRRARDKAVLGHTIESQGPAILKIIEKTAG